MYSLYPSSIPTIFITPTPFRHDIWRDRDPEVTAGYGEAAKDLAKELGIGVVDSQKEFKGKKLAPLLSDGLHLKPAGYEVRGQIGILSEWPRSDFGNFSFVVGAAPGPLTDRV